MAKYYWSPTKQKIMLLLGVGATLALSHSPRIHWKLIKNLPRAWKDIDRRILRRTLHEFKRDRLIDFKEERDGSVSIALTDKGRRFVLRFHPERLALTKPPVWDCKWRVITFDIPEKKKAAREAFRKYLTELGFYQAQRSVWIWPYECKKEVDFIVKLLEIRTHVYYLTVQSIAPDSALKLHFDLT